MPEYSTIRAFITAVQTRRTKATKVLDALLGNPSAYQGSSLLQNLRTWDANGLPGWAREELRKPGLSDSGLRVSEEELDHIARWPTGEKAKVRDAIVQAVDNNKSIAFFWELYNHETDSITDVSGAGDAGGITVRFLSPRGKIRKSDLAYGSINVDI